MEHSKPKRASDIQHPHFFPFMLTGSRGAIPYSRGMVRSQNALHSKFVPAWAAAGRAAMAPCSGEDEEEEVEGVQVTFAIVLCLLYENIN